jgi:hypothetical protein
LTDEYRLSVNRSPARPLGPALRIILGPVLSESPTADSPEPSMALVATALEIGVTTTSSSDHRLTQPTRLATSAMADSTRYFLLGDEPPFFRNAVLSKSKTRNDATRSARLIRSQPESA